MSRHSRDPTNYYWHTIEHVFKTIFELVTSNKVSGFDCRVLHTMVYCGAVRSAILATAWLLVRCLLIACASRHSFVGLLDLICGNLRRQPRNSWRMTMLMNDCFQKFGTVQCAHCTSCSWRSVASQIWLSTTSGNGAITLTTMRIYLLT